MSRSKTPTNRAKNRDVVRDRGRRSEAGDTLIEVLLALIVLGLTSVALLIAFSTSISASATHRTLAVDDTVLATATQETISNIQAQPTLFSCPPNLNNYPGYGPSGITLPSPYAGNYTVLYSSTNPVQYWNTTTESFGTTCEPNEPQLITISLQGTSYTNSFVVDYPIGSSNALNAGSAAQLVFLQQPVGGYAGSPFTTQPIVEVLTAGGSPSTVTTDLSPVILTLTQGTGVLSGCTGNEILGVITFSGCTIGTGGTNFEITATDGSLTPAVSNPFSVSSSNYHLVFTSQPVAGASGYGFSTDPVVSVENSSNVTNTSWAGTITLSLSGGALTALPTKTCSFTNATTITLTALNGTVTMPSGCAFSGGYYYDASRNPPQTATEYTMTATANPNTQSDAAVPATSNTFAVTSFGLPTQIVFTIQPTGVASATAATPFSGQPTVAVEDSFGNVVTSATNTINLSINSGGQGVTLSNCNTPTPTSAGLYVFTGCEGSGYGTQLTLTASSSGLTSATSSPFSITNVATQLLFTTQPVAGDSGSVFAIEPVLTIEDSSNRVVTAATTPIAFNAVVPSSGTLTSCTSLVPQSARRDRRQLYVRRCRRYAVHGRRDVGIADVGPEQQLHADRSRTGQSAGLHHVAGGGRVRYRLYLPAGHQGGGLGRQHRDVVNRGDLVVVIGWNARLMFRSHRVGGRGHGFELHLRRCRGYELHVDGHVGTADLISEFDLLTHLRRHAEPDRRRRMSFGDREPDVMHSDGDPRGRVRERRDRRQFQCLDLRPGLGRRFGDGTREQHRCGRRGERPDHRRRAGPRRGERERLFAPRQHDLRDRERPDHDDVELQREPVGRRSDRQLHGDGIRDQPGHRYSNRQRRVLRQWRGD